MPDLNFAFSFVPNRYADIVQRAAVLYPLTQRCGVDEAVREQTRRLQKMWRLRVNALASVPAANLFVRQNTFLRNCLPAFVAIETAARQCNQRAICPFCYARWVRDVWLTIDTAQAGTHYHVVEFSYEYLREAPGPAQEAAYLHTLFSELVDARKSIVTRLAPVAAFVYDTVESASSTQWRVRSRHLLQVAPDQVLPDTYGAHPAARCVRYENLSRRSLRNVVARVCRYPTGMLYGDPVRTTLLLEVKQQRRFRMSAMFRGFRGKR